MRTLFIDSQCLYFQECERFVFFAHRLKYDIGV